MRIEPIRIDPMRIDPMRIGPDAGSTRCGIDPIRITSR